MDNLEGILRDGRSMSIFCNFFFVFFVICRSNSHSYNPRPGCDNQNVVILKHVKYGAALREMRFAIQLYLNTRARAILFCARALFINLIDVCI